MFTTSNPESSPERLHAAVVPLYQRFLVREKRFTQQYSHIYARRLDGLRPALRDIVTKTWGAEGSFVFVFILCLVEIALSLQSCAPESSTRYLVRPWRSSAPCTKTWN